MTPLIDIGWNAADASFDQDRELVWTQAKSVGVVRSILTGTTLANTRKVQELSQGNTDWTFTAGTHPHHAKHHRDENWESIWADPACVAIGECGLDYFRMLSPKDVQLSVFEWHLNVAVSLNKPAFIHVRDAHNDAVSLLKRFTNAGGRGIVHCFTGTALEGQRYVDMGLSLGCTGWILDERRNVDLKQALKEISLANWLLETDAPYLTPLATPRLPRRNVPGNLPMVAQGVAQLLGVDVEEVARVSTSNATALFGLTS